MATGFRDPSRFPFVPALEAAADEIRGEVLALGDAFAESPDSLTTRRDGYDETGWEWIGLAGEDARADVLERCSATRRALAAVPGLVNAGFSRFRSGTHLYPHRGELAGVLRCHLPLLVPADATPATLGLRVEGETRTWTLGRCLVFDDSREHDAWNRTGGDRTLLLVTFRG